MTILTDLILPRDLETYLLVDGYIHTSDPSWQVLSCVQLRHTTSDFSLVSSRPSTAFRLPI